MFHQESFEKAFKSVLVEAAVVKSAKRNQKKKIKPLSLSADSKKAISKVKTRVTFNLPKEKEVKRTLMVRKEPLRVDNNKKKSMILRKKSIIKKSNLVTRSRQKRGSEENRKQVMADLKLARRLAAVFARRRRRLRPRTPKRLVK